MHLIFENLIKNLILLWTGQFKGLNEGSGSYELNPGVWEAIGAATAASGSTVPGAFGARPRNVSDDKTTCTADMWSFWTLYIGPVLLAKKFRKRVYYDHFIKLVKLINICLQFEITRDEILTLQQGFKEWVEKYEEYVVLLHTLCVIKSDNETGFITNIHPIALPHAHSQSMPSFTLPMELKSVAPFGPTGHFPWNGSVAHYNLLLKVGDIHIHPLTTTLLLQHSFRK